MTTSTYRKYLGLGFALLLLSKVLQFAIDSQPLLFVDSTAFVVNATKLSLPERSYLYGFLIRFLALPFGSFGPLVIAQMLMGAVVAGLLAFVLIRFCRIRPWIALAAALAFAWDPTQIVHEHLVLTEATAGLVAAIFTVIALEYLERGRLLLLCSLGLVGAVLVGVRLVYVPVVFAAAVILPLVAATRPGRSLSRWKALMIGVAAILIGQLGYMHLTGWLMRREAAYHYRTGFFALGNVAPIVIPEDAADHRGIEAIRAQQQSDHPLLNPGPDNRNFQLWSPGGLNDRLTRAFDGDRERANAEAKQIATSAMLRDPLGFLGLGLSGLMDYPNLLTVRPSITFAIENGSDPNVQPTENNWEFLRPRFSDPNPTNARDLTLSRRFHLHSRYWSWMQLLSPLLGLLACKLAAPEGRRSVAWLAAWSALLLAATCLTTPIGIRYLHPLSFIGFAAIAVIVERLALAWNQRVLCRTAA